MRRRARGARARARAVGGPSAHLRVLPREDDLALHLLSNHERFRQSKRPRTYTLFAAARDRDYHTSRTSSKPVVTPSQIHTFTPSFAVGPTTARPRWSVRSSAAKHPAEASWQQENQISGASQPPSCHRSAGFAPVSAASSASAAG